MTAILSLTVSDRSYEIVDSWFMLTFLTTSMSRMGFTTDSWINRWLCIHLSAKWGLKRARSSMGTSQDNLFPWTMSERWLTMECTRSSRGEKREARWLELDDGSKWLDGWRKNGMRSRLVAQQSSWAKRDDVTQNPPPLVAARLLVSNALGRA